MCRPGGLDPCSMLVGVSAPLTVVGDVGFRGCHRVPFLWIGQNIRSKLI